jgi:hypothetical protein
MTPQPPNGQHPLMQLARKPGLLARLFGRHQRIQRGQRAQAVQLLWMAIKNTRPAWS